MGFHALAATMPEDPICSQVTPRDTAPRPASRHLLPTRRQDGEKKSRAAAVATPGREPLETLGKRCRIWKSSWRLWSVRWAPFTTNPHSSPPHPHLSLSLSHSIQNCSQLWCDKSRTDVDSLLPGEKDCCSWLSLDVELVNCATKWLHRFRLCVARDCKREEWIYIRFHI